MTHKKETNMTNKSHTMEFLNPTFSYGINSTVRNGKKWRDILSLGDYLDLVKTGEVKNAGGGVVIGVLYCSLDDLPSGVLSTNHDKNCRTKNGLRKELDRAYGKTQFGHRMVTVVFWRSVN